MSWEGQTLEYYDQNAGTFISGTLTADMDGVRHRFTGCLPQNAFILENCTTSLIRIAAA